MIERRSSPPLSCAARPAARRSASPPWQGLVLLAALGIGLPEGAFADTGALDTGDTGSGEVELPVALAGLPLLAYPDDTVQLDGSASYDPSGAPITRWLWSQVGGPEVELSGGDTPTPQFKVKDPGTVSISLVVSTATGSSTPDVVDVVVVDPEAGTRVGEAPKGKGCSSVPGRPSRGPLVSFGLAVLSGLVGLRARRRR